MLKLCNMTFVHAPPRMPGIRAGDLTFIDCENVSGALMGWTLSIRGQTLYMISPPGWTHATANDPPRRDPNGPRFVQQIPLNNVFFGWQGDADGLDTLMKGGKWDAPNPLGWRPVVIETNKPLLSQVPPGQMGDV